MLKFTKKLIKDDEIRTNKYTQTDSIMYRMPYTRTMAWGCRSKIICVSFNKLMPMSLIVVVSKLSSFQTFSFDQVPSLRKDNSVRQDDERDEQHQARKSFGRHNGCLKQNNVYEINLCRRRNETVLQFLLYGRYLQSWRKG